MRTRFSIIVLILIMFCGVLNVSMSQTDPKDQLKNQLRFSYGKSFDVTYVRLDTLIGKRTSRGLGWNEVINDPYHTLQGCYIFTAYPIENDYAMNDSVIFGFFKNSRIVWTTGQTMSGNWDGIFGATDLNADGEVDIMTTWSYWGEQRERISYMWIFSWDGSRGRIINEVDSVYNQSMIMTIGNMFELLDNINNTKRIRARWDLENMKIMAFFPTVTISTLPFVTYSWDGDKYVVSPELDQVSGMTFLPANKLMILSNAFFKGRVDSNKYEYYYFNNKSSQQNIAVIYLDNKSTVMSTDQPTNWIADDGIWGLNGVCWMIDPRIPNWQNDTSVNMIKPGHNGVFIIYAKGLPSIVKYYIQGNVKIPYDLKDQDYQNNLLINSVLGFTIGPSTPPSPFVPLNFLDTISSYIHQSHTLGWINNTRDDDAEEDENAEDGIVKNLDNRLGKVRDFIVKKKYDRAQNQLEKFVNKAEKLWNRQQKENAKNKQNPKIIFTSEAYALLKYNAEYLQQQLPGKK